MRAVQSINDAFEHDSLSPDCPCSPTRLSDCYGVYLKHHKMGPVLLRKALTEHAGALRELTAVLREVKTLLTERG